MKALVVMLLAGCGGLVGVAHADATYVVSEATASYESNLGHADMGLTFRMILRSSRVPVQVIAFFSAK